MSDAIQTRPDWLVKASDHPCQGMLAVLDQDLTLYWNARLERYEVWHRNTFVIRVVAPGGGYMNPDQWLIDTLRRRDPRYNNDLDDVVKQYTKEPDQANDDKKAAAEKAIAEKSEEVAHTYAPIFQREMLQDPTIGKPFAHGEPQREFSS